MRLFLATLLSLQFLTACGSAPEAPLPRSAPQAGPSAAAAGATVAVGPPAAEGHAQTVVSAEPLTVEEAVQLARSASAELQALERESAAARERAGAAGALPDPEVRLALESLPAGSPRDGGEWLAGIGQDLPLGGARAGEREAMDAAARASAARRDAAATDIERRVRSLHAAGLAQERVLELLRGRMRLAVSRIARARARVEAGDAAPSLTDDARVEAARIEHEIEDAEHARAAQVRALAVLIGAEDARRPLAGSLGEAIALPELEEILRGLAGLPAMREAEAAVALAAARERIAAAERLPRLRLDVGWRERSDGRGSMDMALGFTIPWSGAAGARARAAGLEAAAQRARAIQTERDFARAVADAHDGAVLALHRLAIHDQTLLPAAEQRLARARARAAAGESAAATVAESEDALLVARLERLGAWADLAVAWADLGALFDRKP